MSTIPKERFRFLVILCFVVLAGLLAPGLAAIVPLEAESAASNANTFGVRNLAFEPNLGQAEPGYGFVVRGAGALALLAPDEAVLHLPGREEGVRMVFPGADPDATMEGLDALPGRSHYHRGNDPDAWVRDVPHFGRVLVREAWPGIDIVYYTSERGALQYDFHVAPGADPSVVQLLFPEADAVDVDAAGRLVVATSGAPALIGAPLLYQPTSTGEAPVDGRYALEGRTVRFVVGEHDPAVPLVIDPIVMEFSTFLGGTHQDSGVGLAVAPDGSPVITGATRSMDFGGIPTRDTWDVDGFVVKLTEDGSAIAFASYIGSSGGDAFRAAAVHGNGDIYLAGVTLGDDFPVTPDALQPVARGQETAVVVRLSPDGVLKYATHLGGEGTERAWAIAVDAADSVYVGGVTESGDFPTSPGAPQPQIGGGYDGFVTKLDFSSTPAIAWSTFFGGSADEILFYWDLDVDAAGATYLMGRTQSDDLPVVNPFQGVLRGSSDAFLVKIAPDGSAFEYATYLGGSATEDPRSLRVDGGERVVIVGSTQSDDFPVTQGAYLEERTDSGEWVWVARFSPAGDALEWSTLIGQGHASAVDLAENGDVVFGGVTRHSESFPLAEPCQSWRPDASSASDAYVARLSADGSVLQYATLLRGNASYEGVSHVAGAPDGSFYTLGITGSPDFPVLDSLQPYAGSMDVFLAKLSLDPADASDDRPPVTTIVSNRGPVHDGWYGDGEPFEVFFNVFECGGLDATHYRWNDDPWRTGTMAAGPDSGSHTLEFYSTDVDGNVETPHRVSVKLDYEAPTITWEVTGIRAPSGWYQTPATVAFSATDGVSGLRPIEHRIRETDAFVEGDVAELDKSGVYQVAGRVEDLAGNRAEADAGTLRMDLEAPDVIIFTPAEGWAYVAGKQVEHPTGDTLITEDTVIQLGASDETSGIASVALYIDGALRATWTEPPFTYGWRASQESAGEHTIRAVAYDGAGHAAVDTRTVTTLPTTLGGILESRP